MNITLNVTAVNLIMAVTVGLTESRAIVDQEPNSGFLLSALCTQDGHLRKSCLQDVPSLSLQKLVTRIIEKMREDQRYDILLQELDDINNERVINLQDVIPDKRDRSSNVSGFYSNW